MTNRPVLLPSKDLYHPPEFDEGGNIIQRPDTVDNSGLRPMKSDVSGDAQAMLMSELLELRAQVAATAAAKA
jgi:hypothetical protein